MHVRIQNKVEYFCMRNKGIGSLEAEKERVYKGSKF